MFFRNESPNMSISGFNPTESLRSSSLLAKNVSPLCNIILILAVVLFALAIIKKNSTSRRQSCLLKQNSNGRKLRPVPMKKKDIPQSHPSPPTRVNNGPQPVKKKNTPQLPSSFLDEIRKPGFELRPITVDAPRFRPIANNPAGLILELKQVLQARRMIFDPNQ